jgi:hypothetical protein
MAKAMVETRASPAWIYVNDARILLMLLGIACGVLGLGLLIFLAYGLEQMDTVDVLFGTGVFLMLFCLLLFLPRLRSRGPTSFSLLIEQPMDEVEEAVTGAIEETGRKARIEVLRARFERSPRSVFVEGVSWNFSLRNAPFRERKEDGTKWTEIVQSGFENEEDKVARELRERVLRRLTTSFLGKS